MRENRVAVRIEKPRFNFLDVAASAHRFERTGGDRMDNLTERTRKCIGVNHPQYGTPASKNLTCVFLAPGVGLEPTTCELTDHRNLSETSIWTASARGFRPVCLSGEPVSVWWCAFCAMDRATRKADQQGLALEDHSGGFLHHL